MVDIDAKGNQARFSPGGIMLNVQYSTSLSPVSSMTPTVLGLDGGGSKTRCLVVDAAGTILGRGEAAASNYQTVGGEAAYHAILDAIAAATAHQSLTIRAVTLGLAGVGRPHDQQIVHDWLQLLQQDSRLPLIWDLHPRGVRICPDCEIALVGGLGGDVGLATIAGTGAIAYGRNDSGQVARASGWGYLLGDEGSAYDIGRQGLRAVVRAADGRSPQTQLSLAICQHLGLDGVQDLVRRVYDPDWLPRDMAKLAPVVDQVARLGDAVATGILHDAAAELAIASRSVYQQLFPANHAVELVTLGGTWQRQGQLRQRFQQQITASCPQIQVVAPRHEAVYGAVWLALRSIGWQSETFPPSFATMTEGI
jgi:N-acetylglucosamine kinase